MTGRTRVLGGFSIDAVRYADGSYDLDRLGGNAFWAALGAHIVGAATAVHAVVGFDYPQSALARLNQLGLDVRHIMRRHDQPSTRVTFTYGREGSRTQPADPTMLTDLPASDRARFVDNTDREDLLLAMLPTADDLGVPAPSDPDGAAPEQEGPDAWYLGLLPVARLQELVDRLQARGYLQVDCAEREELRRDGFEGLREVLPLVDAFLPSTSDAAVFLPGVPPSELLTTFHRWGAPSVVLKCGEDGALVSAGGRRWHVPVFRDPEEFDPTGAGDVFGGACAAAMAETGDLLSAAVAGAAAASFATAARTPVDLAAVQRDEFEFRRRYIAARVEEI